MTRIEKSLLSLALLALFGIATSVVHSFDIFWQLQSGKYMLQTKSFIYKDIFSLAADAPRHEHCWLHDVIVYLFWWLGGYGGISLFKGVMVLATGLAVIAAARVRGASWLSILSVVPPLLFMTRGGWLERPQLWTFLCFALFVLILEKYRRDGGKIIFLLLPVMVLWVNLHGGAILAMPILAAYLVGEGGSLLLKRSTLPKGGYGRLAAAALLLAPAALITPYARWFLWTLVAQVRLVLPQVGAAGGGGGGGAGNVATIFNMDWRATTFFSDPFFFYALGVCGILLLLGWRRLSLTDLCLLGGLTLMGLKLSRHIPIFFLGVAALLPVYADAAVRPLTSRCRERGVSALRLAGQVCAVALIVYVALPAYRTYGFFTTGLRTWHYPIEAAEFVRENRLPANLYNTYDWGGYLMWTLYPDYRVFWDGRSDSLEMFRLGLQVMSGQPGWEEVLDRFDVRTVVTKGCTVDTGQRYPIIDRLRESPDWALVFADESSLIFVRKSSVGEDWLASHTLPDHRIDDTILSEAILLTEINPGRYKGWWEQARIHMARRQFPQAFRALEQYLGRSPVRDPVAENYYRTLYPMMKKTRT